MPALSYAGDVPANLSFSSNLGSLARMAPDQSVFENKELQYHTYTFRQANPVNGGAVIMRMYQDVDFVKISGATRGSSTPLISVNINLRTSPDTSTGNNALSSPLQLTTSGANSTSFSTTTVNADTWLYLDLTSKSGTVTEVEVTVVVKLR